MTRHIHHPFPALCAIALVVLSLPRLHASAEVPPPVMGWSSWNTYRIHISDSLIMRQADAMVAQGLSEAGYRYVNIDDGFFGYRDDSGRLVTHPTRFPNGLKHVADHIHRLGLKAGIYSDAGANTCASIWDADRNGVGVGLYGHEEQDADLYFNRLGFDYIKIDYCGAGQQLELDERQRYTAICEAIRKVCPRDISINICRWAFPGTWAQGMARSWRISPDINASWGSVRSIVEKNLYLSAFARDGHYNDMDMLETGRGLTDNEEEAHFGLWCIMSSPLLIGCDLTTIPAPSLQLLKNRELIALNQDPLGRQAYVAQHTGDSYVLVKDIVQRHGRTRAVALYNPSDAPCDFDVPLATLELEGKTRVRDLVRRQDLRPVTDRITCTVPPHGIRLLRVEGKRRLAATRYEAEWAYLPQYEDLGKRSRGIRAVPHPEASGGMVVTNIGGSSDNYMEWDEVYCDEGGAYELTVDYLSPGEREREVNDRIIEIEINGQPLPSPVRPAQTEAGRLCSATLTVTLQPGYNVVRMGSRYTWTPDIDGFNLRRIGGPFCQEEEGLPRETVVTE